jgi:hypothetical protein
MHAIINYIPAHPAMCRAYLAAVQDYMTVATSQQAGTAAAAAAAAAAAVITTACRPARHSL